MLTCLCLPPDRGLEERIRRISKPVPSAQRRADAKRMNESERWMPSGASLVPPHAQCLGLGQAGRIGWPYPPGMAPQCPCTFMRSRFLDNFVLRSAAMLASARPRAPPRAALRTRAAAYAAASFYVARLSLPWGPAPASRARRRQGLFTRRLRERSGLLEAQGKGATARQGGRAS